MVTAGEYARSDFLKRMELALGKETTQPKEVQERYKRGCDRRVRAANQGIKETDFVFGDPEDGGGKKKLGE